jgi:prepilin-type N-terminal cleavage/methylation domain-containing protein
MYIPLEKLNKKHCLKSDRGFTLVETMISLVLLTIALGPALFLATNSINDSKRLENNLIAANLAQEGVEVVRAMRDTNWFNGDSFDNGLGVGDWRVEWNSNSLIPLGSNPVLRKDNGLYSYTSGDNTLFRRKITITSISLVELRVISEVTWTNREGTNRTFIVESHLYDWL